MSVFFIPAPGGTLSGDGFSLTVASPSDTTGDTPDFLGDPLEIVAGDAGGTFTVTGTVPVDFTGGAGDDSVTTDRGADIINGGAGDDILFSRAGRDTLLGGAGDDVINGGAGGDIINGGEGDDLIIGGAGADVLTGGPGADTFRFGRGSVPTDPTQLDEITDFNPDEDIIQISRRIIPAALLKRGELTPSDFAVVDTITPGITSKLIYDKSTGILYYNPAQGENVPLMQLPKGLENLSNTNFLIF